MNIIRKILGIPKKVQDSSRTGLNKKTSKPTSTNSGLAPVKKEPEILNSEASSSKSVAVEKAAHEKNYTRTTQSLSAKAKVEETQDLRTGKEVVDRQEPKREPEPVIKYHLQWDATIFDEVAEQKEEEICTCIICEQDLSSFTGNENGNGNGDEDEYGYYFETANLPEVGMLGCGHCYHTRCLESITPVDVVTDPPCLVCLS